MEKRKTNEEGEEGEEKKRYRIRTKMMKVKRENNNSDNNNKRRKLKHKIKVKKKICLMIPQMMVWRKYEKKKQVGKPEFERKQNKSKEKERRAGTEYVDDV